MSRINLRSFSLSRDYNLIDWKRTLFANLARSVFCGTSFLLLSTLIPAKTGGPQPPNPVLFIALMPVLSIFIIFVGFIFKGLREYNNFFRFTSLCYNAFFVSLGDPFLWLVAQFFPKILPVGELKVFSLDLIIWEFKSGSNINIVFDTPGASTLPGAWGT
jgi:hypothetical protein